MWRLVPTFYDGFRIYYGPDNGPDNGPVNGTFNGTFNGPVKWPEWVSAVNNVSHTLIAFNSAVNFLIYAWM